MITTWVLILYLQGAVEVEVVPNFFTCMVKAELMIKRDDVLGTMCRPSLGYDA